MIGLGTLEELKYERQSKLPVDPADRQSTNSSDHAS
jgi:hypothetical protein